MPIAEVEMVRKIAAALIIILLAGIGYILGTSRLPGLVYARAVDAIPMMSKTSSGYTLTHLGNQGVVTDLSQCMIYGKFTNNSGATGSLNYRVYIDDAFAGTFASEKGGAYAIDLDSTCVNRFGDSQCVNFQSKFSKNVAHSIKIEVNVNDAWFFADGHSPFPKTLTCQTEAASAQATATLAPTKTPVPTQIPTSTRPLPTQTIVATQPVPVPSNYVLSHLGSQGVVTDMTQCKIYGKFTNKNSATGSLNYRVYIDDVFVATFASQSGGSYSIDLNSTCVKRFGDNACINFQSKFSKNVPHTIKIEVNVGDKWYFASSDAPFPKTLTCQTGPLVTATPTKTPLPPTATPIQPTKTPTSTPNPYGLQSGVFYTTNFLYPETGCSWLGIAGQVFDKNGIPVNNLVVSVKGVLDGKAVDLLSMTGTAPDYGPGGYEVKLASKTVASTGSLKLFLYDLQGNQLSDTVTLDTFTDCDKNLIIVNFSKK